MEPVIETVTETQPFDSKPHKKIFSRLGLSYFAGGIVQISRHEGEIGFCKFQY